MNRLLAFLLALALTTAANAQKITLSFRNVSLCDALRQINEQSDDYTILFLYNELEDYRVTTNISRQSVPDAVRQLIGFYPIRMTVAADDAPSTHDRQRWQIVVEPVFKNGTNLTGTLIDNEGRPVGYANVALLSPRDSTLLAGGVSNEGGYFAVPCEALSRSDGPGEGVLVRITCVGYKAVWKQCRQAALGTIRMQPDTYSINGVEVKGSRPVYRMDQRGFTAPIANTVLARLGTGMDVLQQLPFVKSENEGISVMGQRGQTLVYINKRKMQDWSEVSQLASSEVKSVRIVTNPGPEYGAEVGTVIIINTLRPTGEGLGGYVMAEGQQWRDFGSTLRASLNYRHGATDVFGGVYLWDNVTRALQDNQYTFPSGTDSYSAANYGTQKTRSPYLWMNLGFNHQPNDRQYLSMQYTYNTYLDYDLHLDWTNHFEGGGEESQFNSATDIDETLHRHRLTAYYSNQLSDRCTLAVDGTWSANRNGMDTGEHENRIGQTSAIQTENSTKGDLYALKGVVTTGIGGGEMNWGAEGIYTRSRQDYRVAMQTDTRIPDSHTEARQTTASIFATYARTVGKFSGEAGLRYEYVDFSFYNGGALQSEDSRTYRHLFPNLSLLYHAGQVNLSALYSVSVVRPGYSSMQSGVTFLNSFLYLQGNPALRPEYTHRYALSASWNDLQLQMSYYYCADQCLYTLSLYDGQPVVLGGYQNHDVDYLSGVLSWSPTFGCWRPSLSLSYDKQFLEFHGRKYNQPGVSYSFKNVLTLPRKWQVVCNIDGITGGHGELYKARRALLRRADAYVSKQLGNWALRVGATDMFGTFKDDGHTHDGDIYYRHRADLYQQAVYLRATYRFNPAKSKYKGGTAGQSEINRL